MIIQGTETLTSFIHIKPPVFAGGLCLVEQISGNW